MSKKNESSVLRGQGVAIAVLVVAVGLLMAVGSRAETYSLGQLYDPLGLQMPGMECNNITDVESDSIPGAFGPTQTCYS